MKRWNTKHLARTQNIWTEHKTSGQNTEHLDGTQNIWTEHRTSGKTTKHLDRTQNIWTDHKTSGQTTKHLDRTSGQTTKHLDRPQNIWTDHKTTCKINWTSGQNKEHQEGHLERKSLTEHLDRTKHIFPEQKTFAHLGRTQNIWENMKEERDYAKANRGSQGFGFMCISICFMVHESKRHVENKERLLVQLYPLWLNILSSGEQQAYICCTVCMCVCVCSVCV